MQNHIKISDTDSLYICLGPILDHMRAQGIDINDTNKNEIILKLANQIQTEANENLGTLCKAVFNIEPGKHYFQLKQEVIAQSVLVTGKRRYAMYVTNKEGVPVEEVDMKGLELMKSNMNKRFKKFGEDFIKNILLGKSKAEIDKSIIDFKQSLKTLDPRELGKPTGVKGITYYIERAANDNEIFSKTVKGAPINSKSAIIYNDLLRFKKLDKKFESIIAGDKIYIINLKDNPYRIDTIGLPLSKTPQEIDDFVKEYINIDEIFESLLLNKLQSLYRDINWAFPSLNEHVAKFFTFS